MIFTSNHFFFFYFEQNIVVDVKFSLKNIKSLLWKDIEMF